MSLEKKITSQEVNLELILNTYLSLDIKTNLYNQIKEIFPIEDEKIKLRKVENTIELTKIEKYLKLITIIPNYEMRKYNLDFIHNPDIDFENIKENLTIIEKNLIEIKKNVNFSYWITMMIRTLKEYKIINYDYYEKIDDMKFDDLFRICNESNNELNQYYKNNIEELIKSNSKLINNSDYSFEEFNILKLIIFKNRNFKIESLKLKTPNDSFISYTKKIESFYEKYNQFTKLRSLGDDELKQLKYNINKLNLINIDELSNCEDTSSDTIKKILVSIDKPLEVINNLKNSIEEMIKSFCMQLNIKERSYELLAFTLKDFNLKIHEYSKMMSKI